MPTRQSIFGCEACNRLTRKQTCTKLTMSKGGVMITRKHDSKITRDHGVSLVTGKHGFDHEQTLTAGEMSTWVHSYMDNTWYQCPIQESNSGFQTANPQSISMAGLYLLSRSSTFPLSPYAGCYPEHKQLKTMIRSPSLVWRPPSQNTRSLPGFSEKVQRVHQIGRIVASSDVSHVVLFTGLSASCPRDTSSCDNW